MYIETRFYDNGTVKAKLHKSKQDRPATESANKYDAYIDKYDTLEEWSYELEEYDDYTQMFSDLKAGKWVDISAYC